MEPMPTSPEAGVVMEGDNGTGVGNDDDGVAGVAEASAAAAAAVAVAAAARTIDYNSTHQEEEEDTTTFRRSVPRPAGGNDASILYCNEEEQQEDVAGDPTDAVMTDTVDSEFTDDAAATVNGTSTSTSTTGTYENQNISSKEQPEEEATNQDSTELKEENDDDDDDTILATTMSSKKRSLDKDTASNTSTPSSGKSKSSKRSKKSKAKKSKSTDGTSPQSPWQYPGSYPPPPLPHYGYPYPPYPENTSPLSSSGGTRSSSQSKQHKQAQIEMLQLQQKYTQVNTKLELMSQPCIYSEFANMKLLFLQQLYVAADLPRVINGMTLDGAHTFRPAHAVNFTVATTSASALKEDVKDIVTTSDTTGTDAAAGNIATDDAPTTVGTSLDSDTGATTSAADATTTDDLKPAATADSTTADDTMLTDTTTTSAPTPTPAETTTPTLPSSTITTAANLIPTTKIDLIYRMIFHPRTKPFAWGPKVLGSEAITNAKLRTMCSERNISTVGNISRNKMILAILQFDYKTNDGMFDLYMKGIMQCQGVSGMMEYQDKVDKELEDIINGAASTSAGSGGALGGGIMMGGGGTEPYSFVAVGKGRGMVASIADDKTFDTRFQELLKFKQEHGNCKIEYSDEKHSSLYQWCTTMRRYKRNADEVATGVINDGDEDIKPNAKKTVLTLAQIEKLNSIDFHWGAQSVQRAKPKTFDEWYQLLSDYKEMHGHCSVSAAGAPQYASLAHWVRSMRKSYNSIKALEANPDCELAKAKVKRNYTLTAENIIRLDALGFPWVASVTPPGTSFEHNYRQLIIYKERFGQEANPPHTKDKTDEHYSLQNWCNQMRYWIRNFEYNQRLPAGADESEKKFSGQITAEQIQKLRQISFNFGTGPVRDFETRVHDLIAYHGVYGNCDVSSTRTEGNPYWSLGNWCSKVRRAHKLKKIHEANPHDERAYTMYKKQKINLTDEREKRLRDIGFIFEK